MLLIFDLFLQHNNNYVYSAVKDSALYNIPASLVLRCGGTSLRCIRCNSTEAVSTCAGTYFVPLKNEEDYENFNK